MDSRIQETSGRLRYSLKKRRYWKTLLFFLSVPALILIIEILFAIIPFDTFFENRFFLVNRSLDYPEVFQRDLEIFWRFRPSLNISSQFFEEKRYRINSYG